MFLVDIVLIGLIGLIQSLSLLVFNDIKPNLILVFLIVLIFSVKNFWRYLILVLVAIASLNYFSLFSKELLVFGITMLLAFYFKSQLSEHAFLSVILLTIALTFIFYLIGDYKFLLNNFNIFTKELIFNVIGAIIFGFLYNNFNYEKN